jgi:GT2 family glycosyltransferase
VAAALAHPADLSAVADRRSFAAAQTWAHRVRDLVGAIDDLVQPRVSVIVVTYNNIELTKACLDSVERYSDYTNLEVIVVDNASVDGTPDYLQEWAAKADGRQVILNPDNRGFAAANNQGLMQASGDYLIMLNNDTHVTPGWIATLTRHFQRSAELGLLGPVTNNIGNEARIDIRYDTMDEMRTAAAEFTTRHAGQRTPLCTAAFFCVMLRRSVYEKVGPLDEAFGIGFFEDDDYCRRVEQAGWTIACADDVFVHHQLSASFDKMKQETRQALFEKNRAIYESKWGAWVPHKYRDA